jgi:hypothetical protein
LDGSAEDATPGDEYYFSRRTERRNQSKGPRKRTRQYQTALKLAREVEVILGDATRKPKGVTIASLKDLDKIKPGEQEELICTLNAIRPGKNSGPGTRYRNAGEKVRHNRPTDSGKFTSN